MKIVAYIIIAFSLFALVSGVVTMADKAVAADRMARALHIGDPSKRQAKLERGEINWTEVDVVYLKSDVMLSGKAAKGCAYAAFIGMWLGVSLLKRSGSKE